MDLDDVFSYHAPLSDDLQRYEALRAAGRLFAQAILDNTKRCADQAAAVRKVREAVMTANAAVALDGRV